MDAALRSQVQRVQLASSPPSAALQPIRGSKMFTELLSRAAEAKAFRKAMEHSRILWGHKV